MESKGKGDPVKGVSGKKPSGISTGNTLQPITSGELIQHMDGRLIYGTGEETIHGVSIDSRSLHQGDLFVAIVGERYDAHTFLSQAAASGAAGAIVSQEVEVPASGFFLILVRDTTRALGEMGAWHRDKFSIPVIAVTGSMGKTTTKDMVAAVLEEKLSCKKNKGNLNNEYGLPLTLLELMSFHEALVVEMGMRNRGEIAALAKLAKPQIGIITNVGPTHLETLKTVENVARGKQELAQALPENGYLILNGDDLRVRQMAQESKAQSIFFGIDGAHLDLKAHQIADRGFHGVEFSLAHNKSYRYHLPLPGRYNIYNALAALAVGQIFQLEEKSMQQGLAKFQPSPLRMQKRKLPGGITLINDTYNANPLSMEMALKALLQMKGSRHIAVLGDMLELGEMSSKAHHRLGKIVQELGIHLLLTTGVGGEEIAKGAVEAGMEQEQVIYCQRKNDLSSLLQTILRRDDVVLLKASRGLALEEILSMDWE